MRGTDLWNYELKRQCGDSRVFIRFEGSPTLPKLRVGRLGSEGASEANRDGDVLFLPIHQLIVTIQKDHFSLSHPLNVSRQIPQLELQR